MNLKLKICGMKQNTGQVAALQPDYLGFIFYGKSPRNFDGDIPKLPSTIKKVGVFVDASLIFILEKVKQYELDVVQLHGNETPQFCKEIRDQCLVERSRDLKLWKVFSIKDTFDFTRLTPYEHFVDKFLFDTKGKEKGGNGYTFDWSALAGYESSKPFILSGGIGLEELPKLERLLKTDLPVYAIDVNSRFEIAPGNKNVEALQILKESLKKLKA